MIVIECVIMPIEKNLKSRNMVKFFIVMAMLLGSSVASAENKQITSPDGKLVVTVADMDGRPSYSVSYDNVLFLKPSPLGMIANIGDFSSGMSLEKNVSTNKIDETYENLAQSHKITAFASPTIQPTK